MMLVEDDRPVMRPALFAKHVVEKLFHHNTVASIITRVTLQPIKLTKVMKLINSLALMAALVPTRSAAFVPLRALSARFATSQAGPGLRAESDDDEYDLVVIGGGSGGVRASRISAGYGKKVAILEPQLNHGAPNYSAIGGTVGYWFLLDC